MRDLWLFVIVTLLGAVLLFMGIITPPERMFYRPDPMQYEVVRTWGVKSNGHVGWITTIRPRR